LGINEVLKSVTDGVISSSVAKMNEYYLNNADYDERLYTMCHEVSVSTIGALVGVKVYGLSSHFDLYSRGVAVSGWTRLWIASHG
jgi:hypothetical protein